MPDRETKEITTPKGHKLVVYTYITGQEYQALRAPYLKKAEEFPSESIDEKGLRAALMESIENLTLKTLVASFDGKTDGEDGFDLLSAILTLPSSEFKFVIA